jgi:sulfonate transport system substrate-binding protein
MATGDLSRRGLLAAGAGLGLLAACAPQAGAPASPQDLTLRVASFKGGLETLLPAAGQASTPYKVAYAEFGAGNLITEAINARAIDVGTMSEIPPVFAARPDTLLRIVGVIRGDVNDQVTLVPHDSTVKAFAELKGKRIGYVRATTSHYFLLRLLQQQNLAFTDIDAIALSPQDGLAAFGRGALDAWVIYGIDSTLARVQFGARVLTTALGILSGNYLAAALSEAIADPPRHAAIADYLGRVKRSYAWAEAHPNDWANLVSAATGAPASIYLQQRQERSGPTSLGPVDAGAAASMQAVADTFAAAGVIPAHVDTAPLWDRSFAAALA